MNALKETLLIFPETICIKRFHHHVPSSSLEVALCSHISLRSNLYLGQSFMGLQMCTIAASSTQVKSKVEVTNKR